MKRIYSGLAAFGLAALTVYTAGNAIGLEKELKEAKKSGLELRAESAKRTQGGYIALTALFGSVGYFFLRRATDNKSNQQEYRFPGTVSGEH